MAYRIVSVGAPGDLADARDESVERLAFALAIFGAEATLRHADRAGSVTLLDHDGARLLHYEGERLSTGDGAAAID
jgi:hypothetical protein